MKFTNRFLSLCLGASLAVLSASAVGARELKLAVGFPPVSAAHAGLEIFAKTLKEKSGGELDIKFFPLSLLNLSQMLSGVRDGVVDIGFVLSPMSPSELPDTQLPIDLAMLGTNAFAMAGAMTELTNFRLIDVVKHITIGIPGGTYHGIDSNNINRTTWRSLTEPQRRAVLDAAATSSAAITWKYVTDATRSLKVAQQKGIQVHQPPQDVIARSKAFVDADLAAVAQAAEKNYGTRNASQKIAKFRQLVEKWEKLTPESTNWDPNALAEVYRREIFSKIDAKTYGM